MLAECEVFERYRLRDRYLAQLKKIVLIAPRHALAREKLATALGEIARGGRSSWIALADIVARERAGARAHGALETAESARAGQPRGRRASSPSSPSRGACGRRRRRGRDRR